MEIQFDSKAKSALKILLCTDFSPSAEIALGQAVWLAEHVGGGKLTVAHAIHDMRRTLELMSFAPPWGAASHELLDYDLKLRRQADDKLKAWIAAQPLEGVLVRREIIIGPPFVEIIHAVQRGDYDLVVVGTHGHSLVKRVLVGSTATKLARKCPSPVWIARPREGRQLRNLLVPVDFSPVSGKAFDLAASLADPVGATIHLVHAYELTENHGATTLRDNPEEAGRYRRHVRHVAMEQLHALAESRLHRTAHTTFNVAPGIAWQAIRAAARRVEADLIVMGSVGRGGLPGLLIGNTAEKVLHAANVPLLVVKPDDFVSPVPPPPQAARLSSERRVREPSLT